MASTRRKLTAGHFKRDREWQLVLLNALTPDTRDSIARSWPTLSIIGANESGSAIDVHMHFRTGVRYCCCEWGCYFAASSRQWWRQLRESVLEQTGRDPPPMSLTIHGLVDAGAILGTPSDGMGNPIAAAFQFTTPPMHERDAR